MWDFGVKMRGSVGHGWLAVRDWFNSVASGGEAERREGVRGEAQGGEGLLMRLSSEAKVATPESW
jgi:hypothetical protein